MLVLCFNFVSAAPYSYGSMGLRTASEQAIDLVVQLFEPVLQVLLGGDTWSGEILFAKLLFFILILSLVYISLNKMTMIKENKAVHWILSSVVPILAVRYLSSEWILSMIVQYQVLGVVLTTVLPLIIFFFFLEGIDSSLVRKTGWIIYIVIYFGLWSSAETEVYASFFMGSFFLALLFLFLDRSIQRYFMMQRIKEAGSVSIWDQINKLEEQMRRNRTSGMPAPDLERVNKILQKQVDSLHKQLT